MLICFISSLICFFIGVVAGILILGILTASATEDRYRDGFMRGYERGERDAKSRLKSTYGQDN